MKHHKKGRIFGRERNQRVALMRSLATSLISKGKIKTTEAKAKELRPFIERLVTFGKKGTLSSHRVLISRLGGHTIAAKHLISEIAPKYKDRQGGYTRIIKMPVRRSDSAKLAMIEFV